DRFAFDTKNGHPAIALHGLFYAPTVDVALDGPNGSSVFRGGAVINDLDLKLSAAVTGGTIFGTAPSPITSRRVEITSTSTDPDGGTVVAEAVVEVRYTTSPPSVVVLSSRTQ
ncbi:MAG TPA: hypothetical protein VHK88_07130, partial [Aquihabitans sp.]|nr:hypothetical protein [Aquihabitans sp.]